MRPKLFVTDLDGTLLDHEGRIHRQDEVAVRALRARGIHVALCTGRLFSGTRHIAYELQLPGPTACVDGSHIVEASSGKSLHLAGVASLGLDSALELLDSADLRTFVFAGDAVYYDREGRDLLGYVSMWSRECIEVERSTRCQNYVDHESAPVMALVALGPSEVVRSVGEGLHGQNGLQCAWFEVRREGYDGQWGLVVRSGNASKGTAVEWLARHYGTAREDVAVIGDWLNDVPMFTWAGRAFAMAQAPDEVKKAAHTVLDADATTGGGLVEAAKRLGWLD